MNFLILTKLQELDTILSVLYKREVKLLAYGHRANKLSIRFEQ
jgi:hypothetical protein